MRLSSRSMLAIAALVALEGGLLLAGLGLHGGLSWGDVAGTVGLVLTTAIVAGLALRWSSP